MNEKKGRLFVRGEKEGQVWIETVIYLLIAFVMIGLVLSFVKPKIEEFRDKAIIEQSIKMLNDLNNIILTIGTPGNKRLLETGIKKGALKIDGSKDVLSFEMDSAYLYSEPGELIRVGNIIVKTEEKTRYNFVTLTSNYSGIYNLTYKKRDGLKILNSASTPYRLLISNEGEDSNKKTIINIDLV